MGKRGQGRRLESPWIVYAILHRFVDSRLSLVGAFLVAVAVVGLHLMQRRGRLLEYGGLLYFAVMTGIALSEPIVALDAYLPALAHLALSSIAWTSLLVGQPFTMAYARESAPPDVWTTPDFLRINARITAIWGASFLIAAGVLAALAALALNSEVLLLVVMAVAILVPLRLGADYAGSARKRAQSLSTSGRVGGSAA